MPFYDITDDVVNELGVATFSTVGAPQAPASIRWDCNIGGLPFLFAMSREYPLRRETAEFRRQRIDNERDPGEQSLDSGYWLRSQGSWHYGSGITTAEPIESNSDETRFRYATSGGIDPWTPGQLTLLKDTTNVSNFTATGVQLIGVNSGVLWTNGSTLSYNDGSSTSAVTWGGAGTIASLATDGGNYYAADTTGIYKGTLPSGAGSLIWNTGGTPLVRWVKSRLMATIGNSVYELVSGGPALPTALFTHPTTGWVWTDIAEGPNAIYLAGYAGDVSYIYKVTVTSSSSSITLSQPVVVAEMPRGEKVYSLYSYVGSFLVIGSSTGARVAVINSDGSLTVGPLSVRTSDGVFDAVADGSFIYVTVGMKGEAGDRVQRGGLYRINMGQTLDGNPLKFASAPDLVVGAAYPTANVKQVTSALGLIWMASDSGGGVFKQASTYVPTGWLETGRIRLGTVEPKAWRDARIIMGSTGVGQATLRARPTNVGSPSSWDQVVTGSSTNLDVYGSLNVAVPGPQQAVYLAVQVTATDTSQSPTVLGYQVRAIPAPKRTELIQVPVMLFDFEVDRQGVKYGRKGGAWARYQLLKNLETSSATVQWKDYTTGEAAEAYVERVTYSRTAAPTKGDPTTGGVAQVLLRLV